MITKKIKTKLHNRVSPRVLRIAFSTLVFLGICEVILAKDDAPDKISKDSTGQETVASGSNEAIYPNLSAYIEKTLKKMPNGYIFAISTNNAYTKDFTAISMKNRENINRAFGIFYKSSDLSESGFLFIIEKHGDAIYAKESQPFKVDAGAMRYGWGVENFSADSSDSFHFKTTSGSASMPDSDIFRFKLINGQWILSGHYHKTLSRCPDGSIDDGNSYSINFLTSKVRIEIRNDCKHVKTIERQLTTPPLVILQPLRPPSGSRGVWRSVALIKECADSQESIAQFARRRQRRCQLPYLD
jgi:hypothetical protein